MKFYITAFLLVLFQINPLWGASAPKVGRDAAAKYFQKKGQEYRGVAEESAEFTVDSGTDHRYMTFGGSVFTNSNSYDWGKSGEETDVGKWGIDMTYRLSQYNNLLDYALRVSYIDYTAVSRRANKLSFLYSAMLPDAHSKFPLYFGAAAGAGIFLTQLQDESPLSLDYQVFMGLRFFDLFDNSGFYIESGLKNHIQLTTNGQLNGTYIGAGAVFSF